MPTRIGLETIPVITSIALTCGAEALAGWPTNDDVHLFPDYLRKFFRTKLREVAFKHIAGFGEISTERRNGFSFGKIGLERGHGLGIEINRGQTTKAGTHHPQRKTTAATKKINKAELFHGCYLFRSQIYHYLSAIAEPMMASVLA